MAERELNGAAYLSCLASDALNLACEPRPPSLPSGVRSQIYLLGDTSTSDLISRSCLQAVIERLAEAATMVVRQGVFDAFFFIRETTPEDSRSRDWLPVKP